MNKNASRFCSLLAATAVAACGTNTTSTTQKASGSDAAAIIGGVESGGKSLQAVGTVGIVAADGTYSFICTATLISPTTVLTAKHCTIDTNPMSPAFNGKLVNFYKMAFAVGNANTPDRTVEVIAANVANPFDGGFMGLGNDVGVYQLITPITDITPIAVTAASVADADLGQKFVAIGYGTQDDMQDWGMGPMNGTRRMGVEHLNALAGNFYQLAFGTMAAFTDWLTKLYGSATVAQAQAQVQDMWNNSPLLTPYEIYTGNQAGDVQDCHGDSGGPLLRSAPVNGKTTLQIYAVLSGGLGSPDKACAYGNIYSSVQPSTRDFIAANANYVDPCANVTVQGSCSGTVASRCSDKFEGDRALTVVDCNDLGQTCMTAANGRVGCFDVGSDPTKNGTAAAPPPAMPTVAAVRQSIINQFAHQNDPRTMALKAASSSK